MQVAKVAHREGFWTTDSLRNCIGFTSMCPAGFQELGMDSAIKQTPALMDLNGPCGERQVRQKNQSEWLLRRAGQGSISICSCQLGDQRRVSQCFLGVNKYSRGRSQAGAPWRQVLPGGRCSRKQEK